MTPSKKFYNILQIFEGLETHAYKDSAGIWTIGIGTIRYPNGVAVKGGDVITEAQAYEYMEHDIEWMVSQLNNFLKGININQNQFDAIVSLTYNIGVGGFKRSAVYGAMKVNPNEPKIEEYWLRWNKETKNGVKVVSKGLTNRRKKEYQLYSTPFLT
jgi:GH24 family phage-related lysozyme (muramidase)